MYKLPLKTEFETEKSARFNSVFCFNAFEKKNSDPFQRSKFCVLFWILILNSQMSNNNFCAGSPPKQTTPTFAEMES